MKNNPCFLIFFIKINVGLIKFVNTTPDNKNPAERFFPTVSGTKKMKLK